MSRRPISSTILRERGSWAFQRRWGRFLPPHGACSARGARGRVWGFWNGERGVPSRAQRGVAGWGWDGGLAQGRGFPRVSGVDSPEGLVGRKTQKSDLGPNFYFEPRGSPGRADAAKRSPAVFRARVAGTTHPPTPARHPRRAPFGKGAPFRGAGFDSQPSRRSPHGVRPPTPMRTAILPGIHLNPFDFRS